MMKGKPSSQRGCEGVVSNINNGDQMAPLQTSLANETRGWSRTSFWQNYLDSQLEEPYNQIRLDDNIIPFDLTGSNLLPLNQYQPRPESAEPNAASTVTVAATVSRQSPYLRRIAVFLFLILLFILNFSVAFAFQMDTGGEHQQEEQASVVSQREEPYNQGRLDDSLFPFDHNSGQPSQYQPQFEYHATTSVDNCEQQQHHDDDDNWLSEMLEHLNSNAVTVSLQSPYLLRIAVFSFLIFNTKFSACGLLFSRWTLMVSINKKKRQVWCLDSDFSATHRFRSHHLLFLKNLKLLCITVGWTWISTLLRPYRVVFSCFVGGLLYI